MEKNEIKDLLDLATNYLRGTNGYEQNSNKALEVFKEASDKGSFYATYDMACMYYFGDGIERDLDKAIECFKLAVEQGDKEAANRLATIYYLEMHDKENALKYGKISADMKSLGGLYTYGCILLDDNNQEGLKYILQASKLGNGYASLYIGDLYRDGKYYDKDLTKAFEYYLKAAGTKLNEAQEVVAKCYREGIGTEVNLELAKKYEELSKIPFED